MSSIRSFSSTLLLALLPLGFLIVMVVAPLVALAFYDGSAWGGVLRDDYMQHLILWTAFQALAACVLAGILGVPAAWVLARLDFRGRAPVLGIFAGSRGATANGAGFGSGGLATVFKGGMAGIAPVVGGRFVFGFPVLFFGIRTGFAVGRRPLCDGGSGDLPTDCV